MKKVAIFVTTLIVLAACAKSQPEPSQVLTKTPPAGLPNPASVYCEQQGYTTEIRTAADGSQSGVCIFPDGSECDEFAYFRGECSPASQGNPTTTPAEIPTSVSQISPTAIPAVDLATPAVVPTEFPTPRSIDPADYQGWWTYTHPVYGFSLLLPEDWVVEEITASDPLMNGHLVMLHPEKEVENLSIRVTFRKIGEEMPLWPTGVGQGEFIPQGTLEVAGGPARRILLVCPTGQVNAIWYQGDSQANLQRGIMEFGLIYSYTGVYCQEGYSLSGKIQYLGELIVASLKVP